MKNITTLSKENKDSIDKIFTKNKKFDVINSQFVFHYLFGTKSSIDNLVINIKTFLKKDCYILISLFDRKSIFLLDIYRIIKKSMKNLNACIFYKKRFLKKTKADFNAKFVSPSYENKKI